MWVVFGAIKKVLQVWMSVLFGAKNFGFFEIYGVSVWTGGGGMRQCGHFFNCGRPHFLMQKTSDFLKFFVCLHRLGGLRQCGHFVDKGDNFFQITFFMDGLWSKNFTPRIAQASFSFTAKICCLRVFGSVVIQISAGECTPSVNHA